MPDQRFTREQRRRKFRDYKATFENASAVARKTVEIRELRRDEDARLQVDLDNKMGENLLLR